MLMRDAASFPLATRLRGNGGAPLGDVFTFLSGLYFRGKMAYARQFAQPDEDHPGFFVITPTRGLMAAETSVTVADLEEFATVDIDEDDARYAEPLARDVERLAGTGTSHEMILLGSVATGKYVDVLVGLLGERLLFPSEFVGRGDMSRGGLMLRCAREGRELKYVTVAGAVRRGPRPPRLERLR